MSGSAVLLLVVGLGLLVVGAEALVRGASRLAGALGLSPLVIGLTVVAYGTSAPEMAVSLKAALGGQADIALGNVVGSNIFNVLLILGVSAAIVPLVVSAQLIRRDLPVMVGVSALTWLLALDGRIGRLDGLLLAGGAVAYTAWLIVASRRAGAALQAEFAQEYRPAPRTARAMAVNTVLVLAGLALLVLGARWLVQGAVSIAEALRISPLVIGLTIVAGGTSLPEVATSIVAALRGERDIAVGNVVGSNIFNLLAVLGVSGAVAGSGVAVPAGALHFDLPVMVGVAVLCVPIFITQSRVSRAEGLLLLALYVVYTTYVVLAALGHPALPGFRTGVAWGGAALLLWAGVLLIRAARRRPA